ncbi:MAG: uncharacterized protein A8A55_1491 [Amphiamblys sp. WSBS2006]|nr:MAG: uncharacterized protein A8A55_1491 [Amphiamblys sp. WSBS2006]
MKKKTIRPNPKAVEAKEKKAEAARLKKEQEIKEEEDKKWVCGVKEDTKREEERSLRREEKQRKTEERKRQEEEEEKSFEMGDKKTDTYTATGIDECIALMETVTTTAARKASEVDRHPERRVRAAYLRYEEEKLPELRKEFPSFKYSQYKNILSKTWKKAPENPMNQSHGSYRDSREDVLQRVESGLEESLESFKEKKPM